MNILARLDRCAEDVRVHALVIAELKLVDVEMEIFLADLMECAHDPAFHDGPEAFDSIGMNGPTNIFSLGMMHHTVRNARIEFPIAAVVIGRKQAHMIGDGFPNKAVQCFCIGALNHASHHVPLALHSADHDKLSCSSCSTEVSAPTLPFVFVLGFPSHISFVYFDIANELLEFDIAKCHAVL